MATRVLHLRISTRIALPDGANVSVRDVLARIRELVTAKGAQAEDFAILDLAATRRKQVVEPITTD